MYMIVKLDDSSHFCDLLFKTKDDCFDYLKSQLYQYQAYDNYNTIYQIKWPAEINWKPAMIQIWFMEVYK